MREFKVRRGNFLKSKNSTTDMMYMVLICLIPFIIFSTYKNGIYPIVKGYGNLYWAFLPLILVVLSSLTGILTEYVYYYIRGRKRSLYNLFTESYAIIPGVFLALVIPINTPIYLVIFGSFVASLSKVLMGGLGKNKLNPALCGALFITIVFSSLTGGYLNPYELDTVSSATALTNLTASGYLTTYDNLVSPYGNLLDFFFGNIPGAVGETCSFLCIVAFVYLTYKKVIKWRIPVCYVGSVCLISLIICLTKGIGLWFVLFNLFSGGLLFGAVFMATDPVTTPISRRGQVVGGILMGIITMVIRYLTPLPEGVLVSILCVNVITIFINKLSVKLFDRRMVSSILIGVIIGIGILSSFIIGKGIITKPLDDTYEILSKDVRKDITTYVVKARGYAGNGSLKLKVVFTLDDITSIEILSSHETYIGMIYDNDYLNKIISGQDNLDDLDTISGCTYTSKYLKEVIVKIKDDYIK